MEVALAVRIQKYQLHFVLKVAVDFVEICNVYIGNMTNKATKRFNSDKICHSFSDLNFGVTCFQTQCISPFKHTN